jgi:hypothetical protein
VIGDHRVQVPRFKPIPDEEGTETGKTSLAIRARSTRFKPIPDEEGTETITYWYGKVGKYALQTDPR